MEAIQEKSTDVLTMFLMQHKVTVKVQLTFSIFS